MAGEAQNAGERRARRYKIALIAAWGAILTLCFLNRDRFTVDGVLAYTPQNTVLAAVFMLFLFALKSLSVFIFSGILFAANGILFPLPEAIALNVLGAGIMVSLPYWLGRRMGKEALDQLVRRYPKIETLRSMRMRHELTISFFTRAVNLLPSDILSLYMGATGIHYGKYLAGSLLGMLLSLITFPIMGMSIMDPGSSAFIVSLTLQAAVSAAAIVLCWRFQRKQRKGGREEAGPR